MRNESVLFSDEMIMTWMRDRFLQKLVSEQHSHKLDWKENLSRLSLNPYYTYPAVALIATGREHEQGYDVDRVRNEAQRQLGDGHVAFADEDGKIAVLFSWASKEMLEDLRAALAQRFGEPVYIGIGKPCCHLKDVSHSYKQALWALQNKFYYGPERLIYYSELQSLSSVAGYPADQEKELYEAFRGAVAKEEIEEAVERFYGAMLADGFIHIPLVYEYTVRLLVGMENRVVEDESFVQTYPPFEIMAIVKLETLSELKRYVSRFLTGLWEVTAPNQKESHRSIIKKSIHYMEQECQFASLQSVAQKVYMTPAYLSLLFKNNTGKTFIEHLTDIRIDKAKDMLRSTHYKNYEVAEKVGYQDSRYFSQIFKKKVGLSPSEYRESACR